MDDNTPWQELYEQQRHARLGLRAQAKTVATRGQITTLADDEAVLIGEASEAARLSKRVRQPELTDPRSVIVTPCVEQPDFALLVAQQRQDYPEAELAGFGSPDLPFGQRFTGLDRAVFLAGRLDQEFEPASDLAQSKESDLGIPLTATLSYAPTVSCEALAQAADQLSGVPGLVAVVALPAGAGDRIPLAGLTTAGSTDMMVISALRILLPIGVKVRASWAALGWKVAQVALAYGADEIAGWSAAETLAYSGRVRAAARVERDELDLGLEEARKRDAGWWTRRKEVQR